MSTPLKADVIAAERLLRAAVKRAVVMLRSDTCGHTVGPIPKLDGEILVCNLATNHERDHQSADGAWWIPEEAGLHDTFADWPRQPRWSPVEAMLRAAGESASLLLGEERAS